MTPSTNVVYRGERLTDRGRILGVRVTRYDVDRDWLAPLTLQPSLRVYAHSPSGFEWGYPGSGPSQLALALLLDATGDADLSARAMHEFKAAHVARWGESWRITAADVLGWVDRWLGHTAGPAETAGVVEGGGHHGR